MARGCRLMGLSSPMRLPSLMRAFLPPRKTRPGIKNLPPTVAKLLQKMMVVNLLLLNKAGRASRFGALNKLLAHRVFARSVRPRARRPESLDGSQSSDSAAEVGRLRYVPNG